MYHNCDNINPLSLIPDEFIIEFRLLLNRADVIIQKKLPLAARLEWLELPTETARHQVFGVHPAFYRAFQGEKRFWNQADGELCRAEVIGKLRREIARINDELVPVDNQINAFIDRLGLDNELAFDPLTGDLIVITNYPTRIYLR